MQSSRNPKSTYLIAAMLSGLVAQLAVSPSLAQEVNIDRPGGDYRNFELSTPDPALCASQCAAENQCVAWTYVKPGIQGALSRCWLKNRVPPSIAANYAVSGVRGFEYDVDRRGSDYRNFELSTPDPALCATQCAAENQCVAWTYVKPGFQGTLSRCWLKNSVPAPVAAGYAISGTRAAIPPLAYHNRLLQQITLLGERE